jgi:hypothetical protein
MRAHPDKSPITKDTITNKQTITQESLNEVTQWKKDNPDADTAYQVWWDDGEHGDEILLTKDLDEALKSYHEQVAEIPDDWDGHDLQEISLSLVVLTDDGYADESVVDLLDIEVKNPNL